MATYYEMLRIAHFLKCGFVASYHENMRLARVKQVI